METLKKEHLAGYYLNDLVVYVEKDYLGNEVKENMLLRLLHVSDDFIHVNRINSFKGCITTLNNIKPLLYPLSCLTEEIEVNGEKFVPSQEYSYLRFEEISSLKGGSRELEFIKLREYNIIMKLCFDIYGLIESGLAIDKRTVK